MKKTTLTKKQLTEEELYAIKDLISEYIESTDHRESRIVFRAILLKIDSMLRKKV